MFIRLLFLTLGIIGGHGKNEPKLLRCSMMELNHRYDDLGRHCYSQIILWQWDGSVQRHDVSDWWLVEPSKLEQLPRKVGDSWIVDHVSHAGQKYLVRSRIYRQTWTLNDPERDNKQLKPEDLRKGLR